MKIIEGVIGIAIGTLVVAAGQALAAPVPCVPGLSWTSADAVAAQRVPGDIVATTLDDHGGRAVYDVEIRTPDRRLEDVQVDAHDASVLGVHQLAHARIAGEVEAP